MPKLEYTEVPLQRIVCNFKSTLPWFCER